MKTFLINLDRDTARLALADAQLRNVGIEYERVPGVYAKAMPEMELKKAFSHFRWWCAMGRPIASAEIGCALSHYKIYRRMLEDESLSICCIFEDDIAVSANINSTLKEIEEWIDPTKPQVVLLNDHRRQYEDLSKGIHRSCFGGMCTDGYVLTRIAAKKLLEANLPMIAPCDTWNRWVRQRRIELYHAVPAVVRQMQDKFGTTTAVGRKDVSKLALPKWLFCCCSQQPKNSPTTWMSQEAAVRGATKSS